MALAAELAIEFADSLEVDDDKPDCVEEELDKAFAEELKDELDSEFNNEFEEDLPKEE